jgi:pimeloyl-ACP methyl ester carboxylesterase
MIDLGTGPAIVLIPGLQGRWEWMRPAVHALATRARVISFSLPGEPGSDRPFGGSACFDCFPAQIDAALDRAHVAGAVMCGVSFGGLIALRYAATRPDRTRALVLVSTPGPHWKPSRAARRCMTHPRLRFPEFCVGAGRRAWRELRGTFPNWRQRVQAVIRYAGLILAAPAAPSRMSQRARLALGTNFEEDCARVDAPTLIVTGEPGMDHVVPTGTTLEYGRLIRGAHVVRLDGTGHLGLITRPDRFAEVIADFASAHSEAPAAAAKRPHAQPGPERRRRATSGFL